MPERKILKGEVLLQQLTIERSRFQQLIPDVLSKSLATRVLALRHHETRKNQLYDEEHNYLPDKPRRTRVAPTVNQLRDVPSIIMSGLNQLTQDPNIGVTVEEQLDAHEITIRKIQEPFSLDTPETLENIQVWNNHAQELLQQFDDFTNKAVPHEIAAPLAILQRNISQLLFTEKTTIEPSNGSIMAGMAPLRMPSEINEELKGMRVKGTNATGRQLTIKYWYLF